MDNDFLLSTDMAKTLYHDYAENMPILDYHCHIDPREIYEDRKFDNITQVWLGADHYKWRQLRSNGVDERFVTGSGSDREKFQAWAETLPKLIGNPLYHWSHLELRRYFGFEGYLNGDNAGEVWDLCQARLRDLTVRGMIKASGVTLICTTDDPADTLEWHRTLAADPTFDVQVLPAWRPDKAMNVEKPEFGAYIAGLSQVSGIQVTELSSLKKALTNRMAYFASHGCSVSDHGLEYVMYAPASDEEVNAILQKALKGGSVSREEELKYKTAFMLFMAGEYSRMNWVMQLHYGCKRDNNTRMLEKLGADTGYDCIGSAAPGAQLADFLDALSAKDKLPRTILYSLNPNDNSTIGSIIGCFQEKVPGKLQHGSAWWFNDHKLGMTRQLSELANLGCLGNFIGMLTDSRSFLSYTRHEYFRRILCDLIGGWVENGEYPGDQKALEAMIRGISYNNAVQYFGFKLAEVHA